MLNLDAIWRQLFRKPKSRHTGRKNQFVPNIEELETEAFSAPRQRNPSGS